MYQLSIVVALLAVLCGSCALPQFEPFVGGPPVPAITEQHSVALLAVPDADVPNAGYLGGGSIVSTNRVLTAAHVVERAAVVRVWFYIGDVTVLANKRAATSIFHQIITNYDPETRANDLAVVLFPNVFPLANVIPVTKVTTAPTGAASLAGWGFTNPDSTGPNPVPLLAAHTITESCDPLVTSEQHFCAMSTDPAIVCPGDNGSGLFAGEGRERFLIGVLSRLQTRCEVAAVSAFTFLGDAKIQNFMLSQSVTPGEVPALPTEEEPAGETPEDETPADEPPIED